MGLADQAEHEGAKVTGVSMAAYLVVCGSVALVAASAQQYFQIRYSSKQPAGTETKGG